MAHKKAGGSTGLGRDSISKRLGVKMHAGMHAKAGNILVRQRGSKIRAGRNVMQGKDDTLFAAADGVISFTTKQMKRFTGTLKPAKYVHVLTEKNAKE